MGIERPDWGPGGANRQMVPAQQGPAPADEFLPASYDGAGQGASTGVALPGDNALPAEWFTDGAGAAYRLNAAQGVAEGILVGLEQDEQAALVSSFDALPQSLQHAVFVELGLSPSLPSRGVSDEALQKFTNDPVGEFLVGEWRNRAPRKIAILQSRIKGIQGRLSSAEYARLADWYENLPEAAQMMIISRLAGD